MFDGGRMKTLEEIQQILFVNKGVLRKKYKVKNIGIFGSFARGEQKANSDIDVLVEFDGLPDIFLLIDLEDFLKKLTKRKVDVVRKNAVREELKDIIAKEVMYPVSSK